MSAEHAAGRGARARHRDRRRAGRRGPGAGRVVRVGRRRGDRLRGRRRPAAARGGGRRAQRGARRSAARADVRVRDPARPSAADGGAGQRRRVQRRGAAHRARATSTCASLRLEIPDRRGGAAGNVGIISFAARRLPADPSAVEAALVVQNFGARKPRRSRSTSQRAAPPSSGCASSWRRASAGGTSCPTCSRPMRACRPRP